MTGIPPLRATGLAVIRFSSADPMALPLGRASLLRFVVYVGGASQKA